MITRIAVSGYRSLRDVVIPVGALTLITGPNGSGKSNIYKAVRLLADIVQGRIIPSLAAEGGLPSVLWAGPEKIGAAVRRGEHPVEGTVRQRPISLQLGFSGEDYGYSIDLGQSAGPTSLFGQDPEIKRECIWTGDQLGRSNSFVDRRGPSVQVRDGEGHWKGLNQSLATFDSMMTHCNDPQNAPEILTLRENLRAWRFYDHFRTDRDAPARRPQVGTRTTILASDGADLAAALQTIVEIGDAESLAAAVEDAFPGTTLAAVGTSGGMLELQVKQHGMLRPLSAAELSDGTLRYLLLCAALLSPRPPPLLVLNEPETSLHPSLLPALARLIADAASRSRVITVSHSADLLRELKGSFDCEEITLSKEFGETSAGDTDRPAWTWPKRQ